jgi:nitrogenase molybdenum-iron protein alpha/beta subunit
MEREGFGNLPQYNGHSENLEYFLKKFCEIQEQHLKKIHQLQEQHIEKVDMLTSLVNGLFNEVKQIRKSTPILVNNPSCDMPEMLLINAKQWFPALIILK